MSGRVTWRRTADRNIGEIVIDHPEKRNAVTAEMAVAFCDAITALERDESVKVIVISGTGADLTSGTDAGEIVARFPAPAAGARVRPVNQRARFQAANLWWGHGGLFSRILHCSKVTIAAAKGLCLETGVYLALFSDLTVASDTAVFGIPPWRHIGVNGDISMLVAAVGLKRAKELIYCGGEWDAHKALSYGLIDGVAKPSDHAAAIDGLATSCAMIMRDAITAEKQVVFASLARMQIDTGLAAAAVVGGWGTNVLFREGEFNFLRQARQAGVDAALLAGRDYFE